MAKSVATGEFLDAELASDAKGTGVAANALDALQAAGYVVVDGHVLTESEANPPLGIRR
jgi:hypothetical protein